jgi:hypothetical protein
MSLLEGCWQNTQDSWVTDKVLNTSLHSKQPKPQCAYMVHLTPAPSTIGHTWRTQMDADACGGFRGEKP